VYQRRTAPASPCEPVQQGPSRPPFTPPDFLFPEEVILEGVLASHSMNWASQRTPAATPSLPAGVSVYFPGNTRKWKRGPRPAFVTLVPAPRNPTDFSAIVGPGAGSAFSAGRAPVHVRCHQTERADQPNPAVPGVQPTAAVLSTTADPTRALVLRGGPASLSRNDSTRSNPPPRGTANQCDPGPRTVRRPVPGGQGLRSPPRGGPVPGPPLSRRGPARGARRKRVRSGPINGLGAVFARVLLVPVRTPSVGEHRLPRFFSH